MVGISFKISKSGTRYVPKVSFNGKLKKHEAATDENGVQSSGINRQEAPSNLKRPLSDGVEGLCSAAKKSRGEVALRSSAGDLRTRYLDPLGRNIPNDAEASFAINLFPDGFSIDKPTEKGKLPPPALEVTDLHLLPYDRNTGDFLRAIDGGWIPSTLLEDIPCKYIDGCVVCELRDYRDSLQPPIGALPRNGRDRDWMPTVQRVLLQRSSGSIIKDLKSMDLDGWSYQECLELEARLINTVQPPLCLDPTPDVAKEAYIINYNKLKYNIGCPIYGRHRKTSGFLRERRLHIAAAAKALSRADGLAKRRRSSIDGGLAGGPALNELVPGVHPAGLVSPGGRHKIQDPSKFPQATPGVNVQQSSASQGSLGQQPSMARAGGLAHSMSALSVPSGPMSPSLSTPATPATSAGGYEVTSGLGGASSMLGRRESKELAAAARAEAKQMKAKQALQEKEKLQQRKLQEKQDAKEQKEKQRKEKLQQQQQLKIEKQQLSRSNSHLSLLSPHSGSISMGDGSTTPRSENRSSMGDQRDGSDVVIKMEPQEVARPKQEFDTQSFEDVAKGRQEQQLADARKQQGLQSGQQMHHMGMVQQPLPMNPLLPQTSLPTSGVTFSSGIGVQDLRMMGANHNLGAPVGAMAQAQAHALASNLVPAVPTHMDQMQQSLAQSRQRQNSLPKATTSTTQNPGVSGSFLVPGSGGLPIPGVKVEPTTGGQRVTSSGGAEDQEQNKELERVQKLVAAIQRHGLHNRKKPVVNIPNVTNKPSSFHLLSVALSDSGDEIKEPMGQRSMANSLVGGNINSRKTRSLLFVKTEQKPDQAYQGGMNFQPAFHRSRKRLVLCGRAKDSLVEAIIQVGDDQEEEAVPPHHVLPTMSNVHVADRFAKQYCALLKKENYELVSDEVQQSAPRNPVVNAASSARPMPAGASTLGNPQVGHLATTQRAGMNSQLMQGSIPGNVISTHNPMQPSSPSQSAANRMPPPSNAPSRQIMNAHLGQQTVTSNVKPTQIDPAQASQLAAQQQQHHQLQQQAQMQRQPQQQQQQQQNQQHQMVAASQLAQLTGQGQNSVAPQLVSQANQLQQLQFIHQQQHHQQQQQARQHQQHHQLLNQRKIMLPGNMGNPLTGMNNMNGVGMPASAGGQASLANMVNMGGMNNVGMGGMNPMTSMSGMSTIGGMSSLANMGQLGAMGAMGQQGNLLRPGAMNQQAAAFQASKVQLAAAGRGRTGTGVLPNTAAGVRNQVDALSALGANQVHGGAGVSVMGQGMNRANNLGPLQRAPVAGLASPKVPSANQNYYLNSSQLGAQQQQLKSQGAQQLNSQQQQQQLLNSQQQQQQQQILTSQQLNPQQLNTQPLNPQQLTPQQLNPQQLNSQQLNPQQLTTQQLNPQQLNTQKLNSQQQQQQQQQQQLSGGGSLNSLVGNPSSPQLSSGQSLSAVGNVGVSSSAAAAAAAARPPALPPRRPTGPPSGQPPQSGQPTQSQ